MTKKPSSEEIVSDEPQPIRFNDGEAFFPAQPEIKADSLRVKSLLHKLNHLDPAETAKRQMLIGELLPHCSAGVSVTTPFHCSRGYNIRAGKNFYCNVDCVILDLTEVILGDDVLLGPQVNIYTVSHPVDAAQRSTGIEYVRRVTIGNRVWIGGKSVILPGVTIGNDVVIAAGSVVNRDIPEGVIAGGVPARILKYLKEESSE